MQDPCRLSLPRSVRILTHTSQSVIDAKDGNHQRWLHLKDTDNFLPEAPLISTGNVSGYWLNLPNSHLAELKLIIGLISRLRKEALSLVLLFSKHY